MAFYGFIQCNSIEKRQKKKPKTMRFVLGSYWRRERGSNPRYLLQYARFPSEYLQPLSHLSVSPASCGRGLFYLIVAVVLPLYHLFTTCSAKPSLSDTATIFPSSSVALP